LFVFEHTFFYLTAIYEVHKATCEKVNSSVIHFTSDSKWIHTI